MDYLVSWILIPSRVEYGPQGYGWEGPHGGLPGAGNAPFLDLGVHYSSIGFVIIY